MTQRGFTTQSGFSICLSTLLRLTLLRLGWARQEWESLSWDTKRSEGSRRLKLEEKERNRFTWWLSASFISTLKISTISIQRWRLSRIKRAYLVFPRKSCLECDNSDLHFRKSCSNPLTLFSFLGTKIFSQFRKCFFKGISLNFCI